MSQLIHEAFQELKSLKEATFSFDKSGTTELQKFLHKDDVDSPDIAIVDPEAETEKELKNNYNGDVILSCCVCGALISESPENIIIDKDTQRANVDKDCPCCLNTGGFKIVAQIPGDKPEENEEEKTTEVEPKIEETEVEEEEKEPMQETLTEAKKETDDLWDKVYDSLIFSNKQQLMDKNDPRSNRVLPGIFDYDQVDFNFDTGDIVVKVKNDKQLEAAKEILDTKFADKGVTYKVLINKYDKVTPRRLSITIPEDQIIYDKKDKIKTESYEDYKGAIDIILADSDVKYFDEETGEIILTPEASREIDSEDFSDTISIAFEDDNSETPHIYKVTSKDEDGCIHMEYIGENKPINESIENILVETDSDTINVKPSEDGKVTVEAQPKEVETGTLEPVSPETKAEIEAANGIEEESEEETVEEPETSVEEDEGEVEVTDFDEDQFNELGESYLKEVYGNVNNFKITKGYIDGDRIKLEGLINFNSGKQAKTSFVFESFNVSKRGKYKFIGENIQITNRKNAFIMSGDIKEGKLLPESLTYNYNAKDANTGKFQRVYGTVKIKK